MPKKGHKKLRGQPEIYDEVKGQVSLSMTKTGVRGLDELAKRMGLSRSELVEQIGRHLLFVISSEDKVVIKQALQISLAATQDELMGQNRFKGQKAEGDRALFLQQQIDQWQQLLDKFA